MRRIANMIYWSLLTILFALCAMFDYWFVPTDAFKYLVVAGVFCLSAVTYYYARG